MKKREIQRRPFIDGEVTVPGSKSYTARALVIGALASGQTLLKNSLRAEDTDYMIQGLEALGVQIEKEPEHLLIHGTHGRLSPSPAPVFLGGAGTAVRFLTTAAGLAGGRIVIDGNERMRQRPIQDLIEALRPLGIMARSMNGNDCPPVLIENGSFHGGSTRLRGGKSSQFLSSILLCGPYAHKGVEVEVSQDLVSRAYVDLTMKIMKDFGAELVHDGYRVFRVKPGSYVGQEYVIEGDMSSATYFFAAAAITGGRIRVKGVDSFTKQGDRSFLDILEVMGCRIRHTNGAIEVAGGPLRGVEIDMKGMPDSVPTLAVVAAFARGETRISGVGHLRHKETDRLAALERELGKMGIRVVSEKDGLVIHGGVPRGAEIETYDDHRMAMAFAVAGLRVPEIIIRNPECTGKSFPDFWALLEGLG